MDIAPEVQGVAHGLSNPNTSTSKNQNNVSSKLRKRKDKTMTEITKYLPVKKLTRRQLAKKLIFWQIVALSILLNLSLAHEIYTIRCGVNGEFVGWFTKATVCDDIKQAKTDSQELARQQFLQANPDIQ